LLGGDVLWHAQLFLQSAMPKQSVCSSNHDGPVVLSTVTQCYYCQAWSGKPACTTKVCDFLEDQDVPTTPVVMQWPLLACGMGE
jgi:hypothetical protein